MIKKIIRMWNKNFEKGITMFQACLMVAMIYGAISTNEHLVLFSMFSCLAGYLNPSDDRFSLGRSKR